MIVTKEQSGSTLTICVEGKLNAVTSTQLEEELGGTGRSRESDL